MDGYCCRVILFGMFTHHSCKSVFVALINVCCPYHVQLLLLLLPLLLLLLRIMTLTMTKESCLVTFKDIISYLCVCCFFFLSPLNTVSFGIHKANNTISTAGIFICLRISGFIFTLTVLLPSPFCFRFLRNDEFSCCFPESFRRGQVSIGFRPGKR